MQILQTIIVILFFVSSSFLILLILVQSGKGGSLGIMGGGGSGTAFGSSTVDVVEKLSWWMIALFFILAIGSAIVFSSSGPGLPAVPEQGDQVEVPGLQLEGQVQPMGDQPVGEPAPAAAPAGE